MPTPTFINSRVLRSITRSKIELDARPISETEWRLRYHKAALASLGITFLSDLGKLSLSGNIVPQKGLTKPTSCLFSGEISFNSAFIFGDRNDGGAQCRYQQQIGGKARLLRTFPFPSAPAVSALPIPPVSYRWYSGTVPINAAYWAASWIDLADDTNVVFQGINKNLVIITEKLTVGRNVTFTWQRPDSFSPQKPGKPPKKASPPPATSIGKPDIAEAGTDGINGNPGAGRLDELLSTYDAPEIEIWVLDMSGHPGFDLKGSDGSQGGEGGDGGDGGDGAEGSPDAVDFWHFCSKGPGNGGDGGHGGKGGDGGFGGRGGNGGKLTFFAPQTVLTMYQQGFYISVDGGIGGPGGIPGIPGAGGAPGPRGSTTHGCEPRPGDVRTSGSPGPMGVPGKQGLQGISGEHGVSKWIAINRDEFLKELDKPAIISLSPSFVKVGETVSFSGQKFTKDDVIIIDGNIKCPTNMVSDTLGTFQLPAVYGGMRRIQLCQTDGTLSTAATIYVLPTVSGTQPVGRLKPGSICHLVGSGFAPGIRVRINDQDMPDVKCNSQNLVEFKLIRPMSITRNPVGEPAVIMTYFTDMPSRPSNSLPIVLDTFRMFAFGDSVVWGQGLEESQKFHEQVLREAAHRNADTGVYKDVRAHSGAIIGIGNSTVLSSLNGEVPTSFPTILQQITSSIDARDTVDLILIDGGINDVNVLTILNPINDKAAITTLVESTCYSGMKAILTRMVIGSGATPPLFPNSKIIVTGYFPIISSKSDVILLEAFLAALGLSIGGIPGAIVGGIVGAATRDQIAANCSAFVNAAHSSLKQAIDEVNGMLGLGTQPKIALAIPKFTADNAALAPDSFLFGIHADFSPDDSQNVAVPRASACELAGSSRTDIEICKRASVGHPNAKGAKAYTEAILPFL